MLIANTIMLIGVNSMMKETFFINMGNNTVTPGPKLIEGRQYHACHEMTVDRESYIVVTGGTRLSRQTGWPGWNRIRIKSTEILSKSSFGKGWQKGKKLNITYLKRQNDNYSNVSL